MKDPVGAIGTQHTRSSLGGNTLSPALVLTCPSQSPPTPRSGTKTALEHCPGLGPGTKRPEVLRGQWMPPQAAFAFGSHRWHLGSPHAEKICLPYCHAYRLFELQLQRARVTEAWLDKRVQATGCGHPWVVLPHPHPLGLQSAKSGCRPWGACGDSGRTAGLHDGAPSGHCSQGLSCSLKLHFKHCILNLLIQIGHFFINLLW